MNQVQFFYDEDIIGLQLKINEWLAENGDKKIITTNLTSFGKPDITAGIASTEQHVFYILYATPGWENMLTEKTVEEPLPEVERLEIKITPNVTN
jgi:hypothetical protein